MKTFVEAIKACESTGKKDLKIKAISGLEGEELRLVAEAINPKRVFHVRKWPAPIFASSDPTNHVEFFNALDQLSTRQVTGDRGRQLASQALGRYTKDTAEYLSRVILKDLKCGADTTWFKVYPEFEEFTFDVMLASKVDAKYKWNFPCQVEAKYDGQRITAFVNKVDDVIYVSRSGLPASFCDTVFDEELRALLDEAGVTELVLDGEVFGDNFQETMKTKKSGREKKLYYYLYDILTPEEFEGKVVSPTQEERTQRIIDLHDALTSAGTVGKLRKTTFRICNDKVEAEAFYGEMLDAGYEGAMVKAPKGVYEKKRSKFWAKWKPTMTVDLTIVGSYEGEGKHAGMLGGFDCKGFDENGLAIETKVGSGLSLKQRKEFWAVREDMIGVVIEIAAQEICKGESNEFHALRFPVFKKIRGDKR